jgi:hypothetical protein
MVPVFMAFDQNGGFTKLGFTSAAMENHYKVRPDYATGKLFAVHRQQVPTVTNI